MLEGAPMFGAVDTATGVRMWSLQLPEAPERVQVRGQWVVAHGAGTLTLARTDGTPVDSWRYHFIQEVILGVDAVWVRSSQAPTVLGRGGRKVLVVPATVTRIDLAAGGRAQSWAVGGEVVQGGIGLPTGGFSPLDADGRRVLSLGASATKSLIGVTQSQLVAQLPPSNGLSPFVSLPGHTVVAMVHPSEGSVMVTGQAIHVGGVPAIRVDAGSYASAIATRHGVLAFVGDGQRLTLFQLAGGVLHEFGQLSGSLVGRTPYVYPDLPASLTSACCAEDGEGCWLAALAPDEASTTLVQVVAREQPGRRWELGRQLSVPGPAVPLGRAAKDALVYLDASERPGVVRAIRLDPLPGRRRKPKGS
jgi:hypothetical protein